MKLSRRALMAGGIGAAAGVMMPQNAIAAVADTWVKPTLWQMETELLVDSLPVWNPAVSEREEGDRTVLVLPAAGPNVREVVINETGRTIWNTCDGNHTVGQIAGHIARCFGRPADQVYMDTLTFLLHLRMFNAILV